MEGVKLGDRIRAKISYGDGGSLLPAEEGTVVYVHPEGRFYTVEFTFPGAWGVRKFREAYLLPPDPARVLTERPVKDIHKGWHNSQAGSIGKYLETM